MINFKKEVFRIIEAHWGRQETFLLTDNGHLYRNELPKAGCGDSYPLPRASTQHGCHTAADSALQGRGLFHNSAEYPFPWTHTGDRDVSSEEELNIFLF